MSDFSILDPFKTITVPVGLHRAQRRHFQQQRIGIDGFGHRNSRRTEKGRTNSIGHGRATLEPLETPGISHGDTSGALSEIIT